MNFTSILKKIGQGIATATGLYNAYAPLVQAVAPSTTSAVAKIADRLDLATKIVIDAEIMGQAINAPGTQKAAMAAGPMFQLLLDLPILQGKKPKDPEKAKADAEKLGGALADFLNDFEG